MNSAQNSQILLAEDNQINREVINMQLEALGYSAVTACNGKEALELWNQQSFAILLTDCHMPEMDGFDLARAIRRAEANTGKRMPIIAVTANAITEELELCINSGMDDCLTKPLEIDGLGRALDKWLSDSAFQLSNTTPDKIVETQKSESQLESLKDQANAPVNPQVLAELTGGNEMQCKQLLLKFINKTTPALSQLITASDEVRFEDVSALAHKLKSSAKAVGATALAKLSESIERAAQLNQAEPVKQLALQLDKEFSVVSKYITNLV